MNKKLELWKIAVLGNCGENSTAAFDGAGDWFGQHSICTLAAVLHFLPLPY